MKYLYPVILMFLLTVGTSAQTVSGSAELAVLEKEWRINQASNSSGSMLDTDPFQAIAETNQALQDRRDTYRTNEIRKKQGLPPVLPPVRVKAPLPTHPNEPLASYTYQVKVRNNGTKAIQMILWDYVFLDSTTNEELGRHQFISKTNLKPGKVDTLVMKLLAPPTRTSNVKDAGKKLSNLYIEQVNIKAIQYKDGSIWEADSK